MVQNGIGQVVIGPSRCSRAGLGRRVPRDLLRVLKRSLRCERYAVSARCPERVTATSRAASPAARRAPLDHGQRPPAASTPDRSAGARQKGVAMGMERKRSPDEAEVLFTLLAERYERRSDGHCRGRCDGLVHHAVVVECDVRSYRTDRSRRKSPSAPAPRGRAPGPLVAASPPPPRWSGGAEQPVDRHQRHGKRARVISPAARRADERPRARRPPGRQRTLAARPGAGSDRGQSSTPSPRPASPSWRSRRTSGSRARATSRRRP